MPKRRWIAVVIAEAATLDHALPWRQARRHRRRPAA
jgi:hypothetical protein